MRATIMPGESALAAVDIVGGGREDLVQVTDHAEVSELEDRSLGVLVDRDDRLRGLHAGPVLDRAGDSSRDVELRRDGLASLADLAGVRVPAGVHGGPGRTHRRTEGIGDLLDLRLRPGGLRGLGGGGVRLDRDDRRALGHRGVNRVAAGEHRLRGHRATVTGLHVHGVGDQAGLQLHREPGGDLLALRARGDQDRRRLHFLRHLLQRLGLRRDQVLRQLRVGQRDHLRRTVLTQRGQGLLDTVPNVDRHRLAEAAGDGEEFRGGLADRATDVVGENQNVRHDSAAPQRNLLLDRNSTSCAAPVPSESVTTVPALRGGRAVTPVTCDHATEPPTSSADKPRSDSAQVCTGFFFAAMIPLNDGYRGSFAASVTLRTSGSVPSTVSLEASPSRRIRTVEPPTVTSEPSVTAGRPSRSATIAGTTPIAPSVDSIPNTTRSCSSLPSAVASTSEVATASEPWIASSTTCTPASAPICSAFFTASAACSGPTVSTVTSMSGPSPDPASLMARAASTAFSSSSDNNPSTPARSTVLSSGRKRRSAVASGTNFAQTTIFMSLLLGIEDRRGEPDLAADGDRRGEAHLLDAVVGSARVVLDPQQRLEHRRYQRQREVAVRHGAAERAARRALGVHVDPLVVI